MEGIISFWKTAIGKITILGGGGVLGLLALCFACTICSTLFSGEDIQIAESTQDIDPVLSEEVILDEPIGTLELHFTPTPSDTPVPTIDASETEPPPTSASPTQTSTPAKVYHMNNRINNLIVGFNKISPEKITEVSQDFSYQVFLGLGNVWIRIASNNRQTFIDISDEVPAGELDEILKYGDLFTRVVQQNVTDRQLLDIHAELLTNGSSSLDDILYHITEREIKKGEMIEYKWTMTIPNKYLE